jgi:predicted nucleic acid-binding protein
VDAFDADVLIYAAVPGHPLGRRVLPLLPEVAQEGDLGPDPVAMGIGSVLLLPELLSKPVREGADGQLLALAVLLGRLDLRPVDEATAELAVALGASYRLRAVDAVHLATAVAAGADRFVTNNRADFDCSIGEIDVTFPGDLPEVDIGHRRER